MHGSAWRDGAVAVRDYVCKRGNHQNNGDNQGDGLTAGIRKHELLNTNCTVQVTLHSRVAGRLFLSLTTLSAQEQVPVVFVGPVL